MLRAALPFEVFATSGERHDLTEFAVRSQHEKTVVDDHGLFSSMLLDGSAAGEQLEDENDQREDEEDVNERADRWERDDAEQPEDEQDDDDG